jgi:hypothetical protein
MRRSDSYQACLSLVISVKRRQLASSQVFREKDDRETG